MGELAENIILMAIGVVIGLVLSALSKTLRNWGDKQAGSVKKRWDFIREDYDDFEPRIKAKFQEVEREAQERITRMKAEFSKDRRGG